MNSSTKYDPKSSKAEEFINHQEILETLDYTALIPVGPAAITD
jgi:hypothetical protein